MIVSYAYGFVFIKTQKTAGTSVEVSLGRRCAASDIVTPITPAEAGHEPRNYEGAVHLWPELWPPHYAGLRKTLKDRRARRRYHAHLSARQVRARLGPKAWRDSLTFTIERNPWDKCVSHYHYLLGTEQLSNMSFDQYLRRGKLPKDWRRYTDPFGRVIVDRVLEYSNLNEQLRQLCGELGMDIPDPLAVRAKGGYRSEARPYQEYYTKAQRDLVAHAFRREIRYFGYRFE